MRTQNAFVRNELPKCNASASGPASLAQRPSQGAARPGRSRGIQSLAPSLTAHLALALPVLALLLSIAGPARASLALIRQGIESRGSIEAGDQHGRALAAGDFNGDGIEDLATGAQFEDVDGFIHAGAVIVNYGSEYGLTQNGAQLLLQSDGDALESGALFGAAVAAGDFDNDGYDDLAIGAPNADNGTLQNVGYVFVYAGGPTGLSYWHYLWQPSGGGTPEANDRFGASLCVGNFDSVAGSNEDLAIGSPGEDNDAGAIFFYTGGSNGLLNGSAGWRKQSSFGGTNVAGDEFGYSLAAAQVWGGGIDELIVGTPLKEVDGVQNAGVVWVILGTSTGLSSSSAVMIRPDEGDLPNAPYPSGYFGWSVAGGRFFGGSYDGIAIGEPGRSYFGHPESGRVVLGKGTLLGPSFVGSGAVTLFQDDAGWSLGNYDGFGRALAAGFFETSDGYEDLAIGSPTDNANGGPFGAGVVSILLGGPNGPGSHGWIGWAEDAWHDPIEANDAFGTALVFGRFERSGKRSLAIGAPGEDSNAGMVCIAAPWRQVQYPAFQTGLSLDCAGNWVYALRPFDEVCIASTTKIMTVLIACERAMLPIDDPKYVNLGLSYTVPDWIRDHIGGSLYHFRDEQRLTLADLLRCCLYPSGNDAAYAIADMLTGRNNTWNGEYDNTVQTFVAEMNQRAAQLGMTRTEFTNPAGLDKGGPYSCARDMILLAQAAMNNPVFRGAASNTHYEFDSSYVIGNLRVPFHEEISYGFLQTLQSYNSDFSGLKPGGTPCAKTTGVFSVDDYLGRIFASSFGTDSDLHPGALYSEADALMDLSIAACGGTLLRETDPPLVMGSGGTRDGGGGEAGSGTGSYGFHVEFGELPTGVDQRSGGAASLVAPTGSSRIDTELDILRPGGTGLTSCDLDFARSAEIELAPLQSVLLGIAPFEAHGEIILINHGETNATILVTTPQSGTPVPYNLAPGARAVIAPYSAPGTPYWTYSVQNPSQTESVEIGLSESYSWSLTGLPGGETPAFTAQIPHDTGILEQAFHVSVIGTDPVPGHAVHVSIHDPGVVTDVAEPPVPTSVAPSARLLPASPNPFATMTRLGFDLPSGGDVRLEIFDASGRRIRAFEGTGLPAGRGGFDWDGRSADGRELAPGVYFYRLDSNGRADGSGRVVRVR